MLVGDTVTIIQLEDSDERNTELSIGDTGIITGIGKYNISNETDEYDTFNILFEKNKYISGVNSNKDGSYTMHRFQLKEVD